MNQQLEGQIRHIMTLVAGVLVALGLVPEDVVSEGIGILMTGVGFVLGAIAFVRSYITKKSEKDVKDIVKETLQELNA